MWLVCLSAALWPFGGLAQTPPASPADPDRYEGETIKAIQFDPALQPLAPDELAVRLPFHVGSSFHQDALRTAIQNLFASGRYADLAVDATQVQDGIALKFLTKPAYFVGRISVIGLKSPPSIAQLVGATKFRLGTRYMEGSRSQATELVQNELRQNGFYTAQVRSQVTYDNLNQQADVTFDIDPGKRAHFESPRITGDPQRKEEGIIRATRWQRLYGLLGWQQVTDSRIRSGLENIRTYYEKHNLFDSRVSLTRLEFNAEASTLKPTLAIQAGPKVTIHVTGARISNANLRELVPLFQEHSIDPDLLLEGQHNIRQYLLTQGFFAANVSYEVSNGPIANERIVTYSIDRGRRYRFVSLQITGNQYFSYQTIRERLYIEPATFPRFPLGRFGETYLQSDLQAIRALYQTNGFRDVKVTSRTRDNYSDKANRLAVIISIQEGPQWLVSKLAVEGVTDRDRRAFQSRLDSAPGQPFSEASIASDRETLLNYYYDRGYLNAAFEYQVVPSAPSHRVEITYRLHPGEQRFVRDVLVSGLETTNPRLVTQRMELRSGQPLSLAEETSTQRRLYDLGIFARVNTAVQNPTGDEERKDVLYDIEEAKHYSLNVGVGAQIARIGGGVTSLDNPAGTTGFTPRIALGITRLNLFGVGQTLGLQSSLSTIRQRASLTYFVPRIFSQDSLSFSVTALFDNSTDIRTFAARRKEGSLQLAERLDRAFTLQYRFVFRNVTLSNLKIQQLLVPLFSQPETVGSAEFSVIQDERDDPTDAHRGVYSTLNVSYAPGILGSQTHFFRGQARNSTYYPLGRDIVFARSTQFGVISRVGGRPDIPLAERFYSGGSTSIRAFPDFQAGPRDLVTGFPLGGNVLFTNNFELRFPLYGDNLAAVLFEDAGNVYSSLGDFSFRFRQRNLQDFDYTVQSAGLGLRYRTPIGPIRVDFSFSPDAPRFFGLKGTEQDYLQGTAIPAVQKINAFQFHFSLGQAF